MNRAENRRGFALPAVILLVALLTLLLTSGLTRVRTDRQIAHASEETAGALTLAEGGLETYLGTTTTAPADGDSARINLVGGYANVTAHLVRRPADSLLRRLYVIRATGVAINPLEGATPQAVRTVARFAEWQIGYIARRAALTAANGLRQRPGAPSYLRIYGQDGACGTEPTIPGARTTTFITDSGPPLPDFQGAPPLREQGAGAGATIASQTEIDWAATIGGGIVPDYTTFHNGDASYPVQLKSGDLVLAGSATGTGLLIVTGDLVTVSGFSFNGVILVGGSITFGLLPVIGNTTIRGLVISGLNKQLGLSPGPTWIGGLFTKLDLRFDSCEINRALQSLTGFIPVPNAWVDNWKAY